jgi:hypothetical protein
LIRAVSTGRNEDDRYSEPECSRVGDGIIAHEHCLRWCAAGEVDCALEDRLVWFLESYFEGENKRVYVVAQAGSREERTDIPWDVTDDDDA